MQTKMDLTQIKEMAPMFKCWNCQGTGLIPTIDEDGYYEDEIYVYGEQCPICHGRPWLLVLLQKAIFELKQRLTYIAYRLSKEYSDKTMKIGMPTIEAGQPAYLVSFGDEHPEPYSDKILKKMKQNWLKEVLGFVVCSLIITSIFLGLISIL